MDEERYEEKLMMRSQSEAYGLYFVPLLLLSRKTSSQKRVDLRGYRGVFLGLEGGGEAETRCFWSDGGASEHTQTLHVWHISAQKDSRYLLYAS